MEFIQLIVILAFLVIMLFIGYVAGKFVSDRRWKEKIPEVRETAIKQSRSVLSGQFSEQLAPYLPDFNYKPTEARFIGKPIDFVIFKGMDEKKIDEVVFVEVKSGKSSLSPVEKSLKDAIENKKVTFSEYRVPENLTKK
ncbi:MAG TPA: Holliday junction resolvase-like protein [Candidatus Nanoarchaeia archaeon]|nr:Holliday junction resolvase-like protein [Candidatus Nanoarchaeia archaeon]